MLDEQRRKELIEQAKATAKMGTEQFGTWLDSLSSEEMLFIIDNALNNTIIAVIAVPVPKNYMEN